MKQFELKDLVFRRSERFTLEIDELSVTRGEKVAVVGPNGSGKTTLLRLLSFLEQPDSWTRLLFRGQPYAAGRMDRIGVGFLKQEPLLFRGSVAENLAYPLKLRRLASSEIRKRVGAMATRLELADLTWEGAHRLSVGEQRRVALGRVLMADPDILLLDEPMAHLDAHSSAVMEEVFLKAEQTLLLTTHDVHLAHRVGSRVLTLNGGRLSTGLSLNALRGEVREGRFLADPGLDIPLPAAVAPAGDGPVTLILDPRRVVIQPQPGEPLPASGIPPASGSEELLRGHVASVREQGDDVWLEVDCGRRLAAIMSRAEYEEKGLNLHQVVVLSWPPEAMEVS